MIAGNIYRADWKTK